MTKREMTKFKKLLEAEYQHLSQGIRKIEQNTMEGAIAGAGADLTSFAEAGTDSNDRDTALRVASGESNWLRDVSEAMARIENASYGMCEACGKEIPKKRLEVFPSARNCVACQSKLEKHNSYQ